MIIFLMDNDMNKHLLGKKMLVMASVIGLGTLYGSEAQAVCTPLRNIIAEMTLAPISLKPSTPPGTVLGTYTVSGDGQNMAICDPGVSVKAAQYLAYSDSEIPNVRRTNIPGIGIRLTYQDNDGTELGDTNPHVFPYSTTRNYPVRGTITYGGTTTVEVVRIAGDFAGGTFPASGTLATHTMDGITYRAIQFKGTPIQLATCTIAAGSANKPVPLGDVNINKFGGPGSASDWYNFSLDSEDCDLTQFSKVDMTFNSAVDGDNPNLFAINGGGAGVGVDLQTDTDQQVVPGGAISLPAVGAGDSYRFKARYMRTNTPLVTGVANATITINVTYD